MKWVSKGKKKKYSLKRFFKGFGYAFSGIIHGFKSEQNLLIDFILGIIAIVLAILLKFSNIELCMVLLTIGLIMGLELMNTAIEYTVDMAMPEIHPLAKLSKDIAAGSVLLASVCALVVGIILYLPKIIALCK